MIKNIIIPHIQNNHKHYLEIFFDYLIFGELIPEKMKLCQMILSKMDTIIVHLFSEERNNFMVVLKHLDDLLDFMKLKNFKL